MTRPDGTLTPRPTVYRGIPMRSRLEAHYAALWDDAQFRWEYEPRAFAGRNGQYLPDFVVYDSGPNGDAYVEVRPTLEKAWLALPRMQIIWESIPDAFLMAFCDVGVYRARPSAGRRWQFDAYRIALAP